jgi:hypothetical protein
MSYKELPYTGSAVLFRTVFFRPSIAQPLSPACAILGHATTLLGHNAIISSITYDANFLQNTESAKLNLRPILKLGQLHELTESI